MNRKEIIDNLSNYFDISELVGPAVYNKYGNESWFVFETDILNCLLLIRVGLDKPITINNWKRGGTRSESGYRDNTQSIMVDKTIEGKLYLSGHVLGCAFDFTVKDVNSTYVREWVVKHKNIFPCKVRLENNKDGKQISWVHIDTKYYERNPKVYLFDV